VKSLPKKRLLTFLSLYHSIEILLDYYASQVICAYFIAFAPAWYEWFSQSPNGAEGGDYAAVTLAFACGIGGGNGKH
jgi:nicotinamide riboside transporter PnuC